MSVFTVADMPATEMPEGLVILDESSGQYCQLNPTAAAVWRLLSSPKSLDEIVSGLSERFSVQPATCRAEVESLLKDFERRGWLRTTA